jgi:CBS domain-containing protein
MSAPITHSTRVQSSAGDARDFLRQHAPFDSMEHTTLDFVAERVQPLRFTAGETLLAPEHGLARYLYIIREGAVRVAGVVLESGVEWELGAGECFPLSPLMAQRAVSSLYQARADTTCYALPAEDFFELLKNSPAFGDFCTRWIAAQLEQSLRALKQQHAAGEGDQLYTPLSAVIRRGAVSCAQDTPIRTVLATMNEQGVGSIIVTDSDSRPIGVFTLKEVLSRVALPYPDPNAPVSSVMSRDFTTLPPEAPSYEAALVMARHGLRHVPVVENDRLIGVVSESNLFSLQRVGLRRISTAIKSAATNETLAQAGSDVRLAARTMIAQGMTAEYVTQFVSTMNDLLTARAIELELAAERISGLCFCWIAMGSEGRFEQTLHTDQDNGIIFAAAESNAARETLLPLAHRVNDTLDRCGFPLCRGGIMASNPLWCLSLDEWKEKFAGWMHHADPEALLNATIFFDFRGLHGDLTLARDLRNWLAESAKENNRFLLQMTQNALRNQPPLGLLKDFILSSGGEHPHTLDLKVNGITPFVDAARIFSLASGVVDTSTVKRLRWSGRMLKISPGEIEAWVQAFLFIQLLRLRLQDLSYRKGEVLRNHLNPDELNEMDRRMLKEAMRQARKLQSRLSLDHNVGAGGFGA